MRNIPKIVRDLRSNPSEFADEAASALLEQETEITKLRHALTQIAYGNEPLTVLKSIARQELAKK